MKTRFKLLVWLFAALAISLLCCIAASAETAWTPLSDFRYSVSENEIILEEYNGEDAHVAIAPEYEVEGSMLPVTAITGYTEKVGKKNYYYGAFMDNTTLTSISIPDTVRVIGDNENEYYAFYGCLALQEVTILGTPTIAEGTLGFYYDEENDNEFAVITGCRIHAWRGDSVTPSPAEIYAKESGISFEGLEKVTLRGYQTSAVRSGTTFDIRFVASLDGLGYRYTGFDVSEVNYTKLWQNRSKSVYRALNATLADGSVLEAVTAAGYGDAYLTALAVQGVPESTELCFTVSAYVINAIGAKVYSNTCLVYVSADGTLRTESDVAAHTVTFLAKDGTVLRQVRVAEGGNAIAPEAPTLPGLGFTGWDGTTEAITADTVLTAQYENTLTEPTFTVESLTAAPGDTLRVAISVTNNPGILGMTLTLTYDEDVLMLTEAENGAAVTNVLTLTAAGVLQSGCNFVWDGESVSTEQALDGEVLVLTFAVSDTAPAGNYQITLSYAEGGIIDGNLKPLTFDILNGTVTVAE